MFSDVTYSYSRGFSPICTRNLCHRFFQLLFLLGLCAPESYLGCRVIQTYLAVHPFQSQLVALGLPYPYCWPAFPLSQWTAQRDTSQAGLKMESQGNDAMTSRESHTNKERNWNTNYDANLLKMASKSGKAEQRKQTQELSDREVEGKIKVPTPIMLVDFTSTKVQRRLEKTRTGWSMRRWDKSSSFASHNKRIPDVKLQVPLWKVGIIRLPS